MYPEKSRVEWVFLPAKISETPTGFRSAKFPSAYMTALLQHVGQREGAAEPSAG